MGVPQRVIDHWRNAWKWSEEKIEKHRRAFVAASTRGADRQYHKAECGCDAYHYSRGMCYECYTKWQSNKQKENEK